MHEDSYEYQKRDVNFTSLFITKLTKSVNYSYSSMSSNFVSAILVLLKLTSLNSNFRSSLS